MIHGFDVYRMYLAMKLHFTKDNYDFFQYDGKARANEDTYHQRKDRWFFETLARKHTKDEVLELLLATFVLSEDPSKVWVGDIKTNGRDSWLVWKKLQESFAYSFEQDLGTVVEHLETTGHTFNNLFETLGGHPTLLKLYLRRHLSIETLIVMDIVLGYTKRWDKEMTDPLWESVSLKIRKYKPFLSVNRNKYSQVLREKFCA